MISRLAALFGALAIAAGDRSSFARDRLARKSRRDEGNSFVGDSLRNSQRPRRRLPPPSSGGVTLHEAEREANATLALERIERKKLDNLADGTDRPFKPYRTVGAILNAWGKQKYVEDALKVVKNVMAASEAFNAPGSFTVWANTANREFLEGVAANNPHIIPRFYEDVELPPKLRGCSTFQAPPQMFMTKIVALTHSKYDLTLVIDNDIHVCDDPAKLFPRKGHDFDVASAVAPFARWGGSRHKSNSNLTLLPASEKQRANYKEFQERNVGVMVLRTHQPAVKRLLKSWLKLFVRGTSTHQMCMRYHHEQPAFREALWKVRNDLIERLVSPKTICRDGDQKRGCTTKKGCLKEGCLIVHCRVQKDIKHMTRLQAKKLRYG